MNALRVFHNCYSFLFLCQNHRDFSQLFTLRNWWGSCGCKVKVWQNPLKLSLSQELLTLIGVHTQPPTIPHSDPALACMSCFCSRWVDLISDSPNICFSRFWGGSLPCDLNFLIGPRKVINFQFVQPFVVVLVKVAVIISSLFAC